MDLLLPGGEHCAAAGLPYRDVGLPLPLATFVACGFPPVEAGATRRDAASSRR